MNTKEIPDGQIPFSKPKHVGYVLSCLREHRAIYSIPLDATTLILKELLGRAYPINAEPLTKPEFVAVFPHIIGSIELCWFDDLEFLIEGTNLPLDWE
jgi:hypothetical protein